ncbi:MAG: c-type cytochrome [Verrucomicrobia bacterium]|nr:c-type cytochrome [Verrucomicrobiota bacterium]
MRSSGANGCGGLAALLLVLTLHSAEPPVAADRMPRVPPTEANHAAATFQMRPGFEAQLVASEPLVASPVAVAVDELGRAYVVEMRDYSERRPERLGRVRRLEDSDGDGRYDRATVFLEGLPWPTAVTCWNGGIFLGSTPGILFAKDADGDGVAEIVEPVFDGFAADYAPFETNRLNVQALMNSFQWGLDQRIHGATSLSGGAVRRVDSGFIRAWRQAAGVTNDANEAVSLRGRDFSFDPRTLELRAESGGGQHGLSFDDAGRKFVCANSDHLQLVAFDAEAQPANPFRELPGPRASIAADGPAAEVYRRSPDEPWRVFRTRWRVAGLVEGPVEGGGRASGYFTGATGTTIYRGDAGGPEIAGDAFIGDAGGNLVHRKKLRPVPDGYLLSGERAADEQQSEFLASTDNWFRPVQFYNAPDGCLWVVDMYREVIEHPWSLPANLKAHLDLDSGRDRGRLWRLAPAGFRATPDRMRLGDTNLNSLVAALSHPNGWHRDTASRLLTERGGPEVAVAVRGALTTSTNALARLHALGVLNALEALTGTEVVRAARDDSPAVRRLALLLAGGGGSAASHAELSALAADPDPWVRLALALAVARWPETERLAPLEILLRRGPDLVRDVAMSSAGTADVALFTRMAGLPEIQSALAAQIGRRADPAGMAAVEGRLRELAEADPADAWHLATRLGQGLRTSGAASQVPMDGQVFGKLTEMAVRTASDPQASNRVAAVRFLAQRPWASAAGDWPIILQTAQDPAVQAAVVETLGESSAPEASQLLMSAWPRLLPQSRQQALVALGRRPAGIRALLDAVEAGQIAATAIPVDLQNRIRSHADAGLQSRGRALFGEVPASRAELVTAFLPALQDRGQPDRGAVVFRERCATCHALRGEGVALGPDLASVASNGPEKLLVSILDPNRDLTPNYVAWTAETRAGEVVTGILVRETDTAVTLRQAGGAEVTLSRADLTRCRPDGRSLMPEGLESGLTPSDLADLLAHLTQLPQ